MGRRGKKGFGRRKREVTMSLAQFHGAVDEMQRQMRAGPPAHLDPPHLVARARFRDAILPDSRDQPTRAANKQSAHRDDPKIGFPTEFFDGLMRDPAQPRRTTDTVMGKGGVQHTVAFTQPQNESQRRHVDDITRALPVQFGRDPEVRRLLSTAPSGHGMATFREVVETLAARTYAAETNVAPGSIGWHDTTIDFHGTQSGAPHYFDPFRSPSGGEPPVQVKKQNVLAGHPEDHFPAAASKLRGLDTSWATSGGAYHHHTSDAKGGGTKEVTGVWDQTWDSPERVTHLQKELKSKGTDPGRVHSVDARLDDAFVAEDQRARTHLYQTSENYFLKQNPGFFRKFVTDARNKRR